MSNINSLSALRKKEEEDQKRNEYYVGGTDNRGGGSGLAVLGPNSGSSPNPGTRSPNPGGHIFDSIVNRASSDAAQQGPPPDSANCRRITMYRNGFIVDDGPFRDLNSPESREFIAHLERGDVPPEMRSGGRPGPVDVHLDDRRGEDYVPPPPPAYVAFSGQGVSLRGEGSSSSSSSFTPEALANVSVAVDESAPTTVLQIRTHDGKKLRLKINQSSTVLQLAAMVRRDANLTGAFALSAGFPPKDLTDGNSTVQEAGLNGAAVTVKLL